MKMKNSVEGVFGHRSFLAKIRFAGRILALRGQELAILLLMIVFNFKFAGRIADPAIFECIQHFVSSPLFRCRGVACGDRVL